MSTSKDYLENFIKTLEENNLLREINRSKSGIELFTEKYRIYIYPPNQPRVNSTSRLLTIHLDVDLLASSLSKIVQRVKGLHGLGERIFARQAVVARIDKRIAMEFLEEHHLQVALAGKYRYGLFYQGELVSVAVFSGGRKMNQMQSDYRSFELLRFCHKSDLAVIGGISKLIQAFVKDFNPQDIMTYSDKDWGGESSLQKIGFVIEGETAPQRFYIQNGQRKYTIDDGEKCDYEIENCGSLKLKLYL